MPSISVTNYWGPQPPSGAGTPPSFALDAANSYVTSLYGEKALLLLLDPLSGDALRRLAGGSQRYSKEVTAVVIQAKQDLGQGDQVKDLVRQTQELTAIENAHRAHEHVYACEATTIHARRDAIRTLVEPLVTELLEDKRQEPKVLQAITNLRAALAEDEEKKKNTAKAREEGRSESLPLLAQRESELNDLRLHLDQRQKQVDFLNNKVAELEARLAGLSAPAAKNSRSTPR